MLMSMRTSSPAPPHHGVLLPWVYFGWSLQGDRVVFCSWPWTSRGAEEAPVPPERLLAKGWQVLFPLMSRFLDMPWDNWENLERIKTISSNKTNNHYTRKSERVAAVLGECQEKKARDDLTFLNGGSDRKMSGSYWSHHGKSKSQVSGWLLLGLFSRGCLEIPFQFLTIRYSLMCVGGCFFLLLLLPKYLASLLGPI